MIKKIEELTLKEINSMHFLTKEELKKLSFSEICVYMEWLNKVNERFQTLSENKGE